ncbi:MAG: DUF3617 family protein [Gammaproteobacteria bacterium]|nr:DUF3617 family protein [Gammaproteobacteria bacterium]
MRNTTIVAILALGATCSASAAPPRLKPGLWQISVQSSNGRRPPRTSRLCVDEHTLDLLSGTGAAGARQACSRNDKKVTGNQMAVDSVCRFAGSVISSHVVVTYQGDRQYHIESHSKYTPAFFGHRETSSQQTGTWTGQCPQGMKPGDMITSEGIHTNLLNMGSGQR